MFLGQRPRCCPQATVLNVDLFGLQPRSRSRAPVMLFESWTDPYEIGRPVWVCSAPRSCFGPHLNPQLRPTGRLPPPLPASDHLRSRPPHAGPAAAPVYERDSGRRAGARCTPGPVPPRQPAAAACRAGRTRPRVLSTSPPRPARTATTTARSWIASAWPTVDLEDTLAIRAIRAWSGNWPLAPQRRKTIYITLSTG